MNKRQAKKEEQKLHLVGGSYKTDKKFSRFLHEEDVSEVRRYLKNGEIPSDFSDLIEIGIYTKEDVRAVMNKRLKMLKRKRKAVRVWKD